MKNWKLAMLMAMLFVGAGVNAGPVNINAADAETLAQELKGIGLSRAEAIVAYRNQHGKFNSVDELANVKGIGVSILEKNRDNILLSGKAGSDK